MVIPRVAWFMKVVHWPVRMTGQLGYPRSMVPEAEFFACAHVMRLS